MHYRFLAAVYVGDTMFPLFMVTAETCDMLALEGRGDQAKIAAHLANCRLFAGNQVHEKSQNQARLEGCRLLARLLHVSNARNL